MLCLRLPLTGRLAATLHGATMTSHDCPERAEMKPGTTCIDVAVKRAGLINAALAGLPAATRRALVVPENARQSAARSPWLVGDSACGRWAVAGKIAGPSQPHARQTLSLARTKATLARPRLDEPPFDLHSRPLGQWRTRPLDPPSLPRPPSPPPPPRRPRPPWPARREAASPTATPFSCPRARCAAADPPSRATSPR